MTAAFRRIGSRYHGVVGYLQARCWFGHTGRFPSTPRQCLDITNLVTQFLVLILRCQ
jgi:hypothetical protein